MRTPPPPAAPLAIHLAPNAITLLCMPAGSTLRLASGSLAIHAGPLILGQVIAAQQPTGVLHAQGEWTAPCPPVGHVDAGEQLRPDASRRMAGRGTCTGRHQQDGLECAA